MMKLIFLIFMVMSAWSQDVKIETQPSKPIVGEVFQVYFRIFTDLDADPEINFSPGGLEIVGKSNQGVSTRTIYSNGKITVSREITVAYEMVSNKPGFSYLRDIQVQLGSKKFRSPTFNIEILKEAQETPEVFMKAEVSKKNIYLGEGITVRYYLYSRVGVNSLDVKTYPKLNNFLKRFLQEPESSERVSVDGMIYVRTKIYSARVFSEKIGLLKIDPMSISVTYQPAVITNPFGSFSSGGLKRKTIKSDEVQIEVNPLPEPQPQSFIGLIGVHKIDLQQNHQKVLVNEPLEFKLTISGPGALENLEAPKIIFQENLEEFETNGELKIIDAQNSVKDFTYTYLPKAPMKILDKDISMSYFNPETKQYVPINLKISEISVGGNAIVEQKSDKQTETKPIVQPIEKVSQKLNQIDFSKISVFSINQFLYITLGLFFILIFGIWLKQSFKIPLKAKSYSIPTSFKQGNIQHNQLIKWLSPLMHSSDSNLKVIISNSELPREVKDYFLDLLEISSSIEYSQNRKSKDLTFNKKLFNEMKKHIEKKNEDL